MLNILLVASESAPFAKTGGLADVCCSLPQAFDKSAIDARVIMPKYRVIDEQHTAKMTKICNFTVQLGWREQYCGLFSTQHKGVTFYFIDNEFYFGAPDVYTSADWDAERFAFFSKAVLCALPHIGFRPDVIHCNDWQTGLVPVFLHAEFQGDQFYNGIKTVMTIHNLKFQGQSSIAHVRDVTGLDPSYFTHDKLEFHSGANYLKGGLVYADYITTVSPTYAHEVKTPYFGEGLDHLLKARAQSMCGILNGIDDVYYNPATDKDIYYRYNRRDFVSQKKLNKVEFQRNHGLTIAPDTFMIGIVSRLTDQKGIDLVIKIIEKFSHHRVQLVVLGAGEKRYEEAFKYYSEKYPQSINAKIGFDNAHAHKIYAACDGFLMPSLFEPCGLSQIISMRYGTIPIVRETGGLVDTIVPFNEFENTGTGFSFRNYDEYDLDHILGYAVNLYEQKPKVWNDLIRRAMAQDFSWGQSAARYAELYAQLCFAGIRL